MLQPGTVRTLQTYGYNSLREYLEDLSDQYSVPYSVVKELYYLLGESELWDGLVSAVQDAEAEFAE